MKNLIKKNKYQKSLNEKGMALLATVIFVFVLGLIAVSLLTMASNDSKLSTLQRESNRAFYIAETGIDKALWFVNFSPYNSQGINFRGTYGEENGNEKFEVVVKDGDSSDGIERIVFESTGTVLGQGQYDKGERAIEVVLVKDTAPNNFLAYNYAVLTDSNMTIHGNIFIHGDIHSNGDLGVAGASFELVNGTASATGTITGYPEGINQGYQTIPKVDFNYYYNLAVNQGNYYGDNTSVIFNTTQTLEGIHYIDGDVIIKPPCSSLTISDGAIFATGSITVQGNVDVYIEHSEFYDNPLALVAKGDITCSGGIHGEGIIQTESSFILNGGINIEKGAVVADDGIFNGGGGTMNIVYDKGYQEEVVVGTLIDVWKKVSWQEI
jgi:hypothetical protein